MQLKKRRDDGRRFCPSMRLALVAMWMPPVIHGHALSVTGAGKRPRPFIRVLSTTGPAKPAGTQMGARVVWMETSDSRLAVRSTAYQQKIYHIMTLPSRLANNAHRSVRTGASVLRRSLSRPAREASLSVFLVQILIPLPLLLLQLRKGFLQTAAPFRLAKYLPHHPNRSRHMIPRFGDRDTTGQNGIWDWEKRKNWLPLRNMDRPHQRVHRRLVHRKFRWRNFQRRICPSPSAPQFQFFRPRFRLLVVLFLTAHLLVPAFHARFHSLRCLSFARMSLCSISCLLSPILNMSSLSPLYGH